MEQSPAGSVQPTESAARKRPLKVGLILPDTEREMGSATARWSDLVEMAQLAETHGFDSLWNADHLIYRFAGRDVQGPWECWSLLAALAAVTQRVELGPLVSCTSFRNPTLLAKIADTIDEISGGRLILGLGAGWHEPEYAAFGYPYDHRVSRFAEAIAIIHGLLRQGQIDFDGTYYQARDCELRPRGPRPQGPPIMIGTTGERMLQLSAQYADIWNAWGLNTPQDVVEPRAKVDAACVAAGRDPSSLERTCTVLLDLAGAAGRPREKPPYLAGDPEVIAETLRGLAREGISHVQIVLDPNTVKGVEAVAPILENLDRG